MVDKVKSLEKKVKSLEYMEGLHSKRFQKLYERVEEMEKKMKEW